MIGGSPRILEVLSQPSLFFGLVMNALLPFSVIVGLYLVLLILGHCLSVFLGNEIFLDILHYVGWGCVAFTPLIIGSILEWNSKISRACSSSLFVLIFLLVPHVILKIPLGWALTFVCTYFCLKALTYKDIFAIEVLIVRYMHTPFSHSHLFFLEEEKRYV